jgi:molybdopterin-containing oxidoreductase family iron-sulfur binding subunit
MSTNKKYWKGIEELENNPEFIKNRDNEFGEELPIDAFLGDEKLKETSTSRRDFLKFLGFSVTAATLAACEAPVIKSIPYVAKPEDVTPGMPVKTREGRPIFIKANNKYGITKAASNARVTASVMSVYDSSRLVGPRKGGKDTDWATLDKEVGEKLQAIAKSGGQVRIVTGTVISPATQSLLRNVMYTLGGSTTAAPVAEVAAEPIVAVDSAAAPVAEPVLADLNVATMPANIKWVQYKPIKILSEAR